MSRREHVRVLQEEGLGPVVENVGRAVPAFHDGSGPGEQGGEREGNEGGCVEHLKVDMLCVCWVRISEEKGGLKSEEVEGIEIQGRKEGRMSLMMGDGTHSGSAGISTPSRKAVRCCWRVKQSRH